MKLRAYHYDLPLRHVFTISRGSVRVQPTLIVELEEDGLRGYGEATANDYYGFSIDTMAADLARARPLIERRRLEDPESLWEELQPVLGADPFALCAVDQAAHDLWGKREGRPVYHLWGLSANRIPLTNYTIGIDTVEKMEAKLAEVGDWPLFKIKLGTDRDLEIVRALRRRTDAVFRVDANCGWTEDEALRNAEALREWKVEFIEQPLPADQWAAMARVYERSALPLIADESCVEPGDVDRCCGFFHGVNIKLVKCGGLTPARRMIARARHLGLKVMVGCMTESTVGISAIAQLAPLLDYVDMDGALLLAQDIATGVTIERGRCRYADAPGCGVQLVKSGRELSL